MINNDRKNTIKETYNLKKFVMTYFQRVGALVEEVGFELVEVVLPDELTALLGGEMLLLAFDYEVAQENQDSIFLTYGSDLLDRIVQASLKMGRFVELFWPQTEINLPAHLERSLVADFDFIKCKAPTIDHWGVHEHAYYLFEFRTMFQSYGQVEEITSVLIDGYTGQVQNDLLEYWRKVLPDAERLYHWPRLQELPLSELHTAACLALESSTRKRSLILEAESANHYERELKKMEHYFAENISALNRRLTKTNDETHRERLQSQISVTMADQQRREKDIRERYTVTARAELDGLVIYYQPKIELHLLLQQRNEVFQFVLYYNPLDGRVEPPLCPHCHQSFRQITRDTSGIPCCVDCRLI